MAGWDGEIFLHATTRMSMVSYFLKPFLSPTSDQNEFPPNITHT